MEQENIVTLTTNNKATIPKRLVDALGWTEGTKLYTNIEGRSIVLRKVTLEVEK